MCFKAPQLLKTDDCSQSSHHYRKKSSWSLAAWISPKKVLSSGPNIYVSNPCLKPFPTDRRRCLKSKYLHTYLPSAHAQDGHHGFGTECHEGGHGACRDVLSEQITWHLLHLRVLTLAPEGGAGGWGRAAFSCPGMNREVLLENRFMLMNFKPRSLVQSSPWYKMHELFCESDT